MVADSGAALVVDAEAIGCIGDGEDICGEDSIGVRVDVGDGANVTFETLPAPPLELEDPSMPAAAAAAAAAWRSSSARLLDISTGIATATIRASTTRAETAAMTDFERQRGVKAWRLNSALAGKAEVDAAPNPVPCVSGKTLDVRRSMGLQRTATSSAPDAAEVVG